MKFDSTRISSYFAVETKILVIVTLSGIIYNAGSLYVIYLEGKLIETLSDILLSKSDGRAMIIPVVLYLLVTFVIQFSRSIKRFSVRRFANNTKRRMKTILYSNLLGKRRTDLENENEGELMTKAVSDTEDTAEGMRKALTEIFDTGVLSLSYVVMLFYYDWRLTLLSLLFIPFAYMTASMLKKPIQKAGEKEKKASSELRSMTLEGVSNSLTYRIYGVEKIRSQHYEEALSYYEKTATGAGLYQTIPPFLYLLLSSTGIIFILYYGGRNVLSSGWREWSLAAFTTYFSLYSHLVTKAFKAGKLFSAMEKAEVSWKRIKPLLKKEEKEKTEAAENADELLFKDYSLSFNGKGIIDSLSLDLKKGMIIGITGPVGCGKTIYGKSLIGEVPYSGAILWGGKELSSIGDEERDSIIGYLGHDPELFYDTIENNVLLGKDDDLFKYLRAVELDKETESLPLKEKTEIGNRGSLLSGGQRKRTALARTFSHPTPYLYSTTRFHLSTERRKMTFSAISKNTGRTKSYF